MALTTQAPRVLADVLPTSRIRSLLLVLIGAAFVGFAAQVSISIGVTPAPLSGQTIAVLLVGAALGCVRGTLAMLVYTVGGVAGMPWFADGASGYSSVSVGYLIGFVIAAGLVGFLAERNWTRTPLDTALAMVLGNITIYFFGVAGLAIAIHTSVSNAIALGMSPFLLGDGIKIAVATVLFPLAWSYLVRKGRAAPYVSSDVDVTDADEVLDLTEPRDSEQVAASASVDEESVTVGPRD